MGAARAVNFCHFDGLLWALNAQRHSWLYRGQPAMEILTIDSRSHSSFLPLQSACFVGSRRELSMVVAAVSWNCIVTVPGERSCSALAVGGTDPLCPSTVPTFALAGRWLSISAHPYQAVDLESGERRWVRKVRGGLEGRHVLNTHCKALVWFTEEASGVSEAMVPFRVFGFGATAPWIWGSIQFPSSQPCRGTPLLSLHLGFLTVDCPHVTGWCLSDSC